MKSAKIYSINYPRFNKDDYDNMILKLTDECDADFIIKVTQMILYFQIIRQPKLLRKKIIGKFISHS